MQVSACWTQNLRVKQRSERYETNRVSRRNDNALQTTNHLSSLGRVNTIVLVRFLFTYCMNEITEKPCALIAPSMLVQRETVCLSNLAVINAIFSVAENGCKWRALWDKFVMAAP